MLRLLLFIFLCLLHGGLLEQDPAKCTQTDAGTNQVMYYLLRTYDPGSGSQKIAYCSSFDDNLQGPACHIDRGIMYSTTSVGGDLLMNMDFAVLKEASGPNSEYDMQYLGYPITYMNLGQNDKKNIATFIEFHVFKSNVVPENNDLLNIHVCGFYHRGCRLRDDQEFCADHNMCLLMPSDPLDLVYLDMALYVNEYHSRNAYFFVKKGNKVGVYSIEFSVLLEGRPKYGNSAFPKFQYTDVNNMELIRNFPQHNYQEHFFAFDAHFGCFALLYWEGSRSHTPEVHYYLFDENRPSADVKLVDKIVLHGFDFYDIFDRSKGYYANILTFPVFKSFGRQVFIGVQKTPGADRQRYRIWTPNRAETRSSDDCNTKTYPDNLHIVHARRTFLVDGRWIQTEKAQPIQPTTTTKATTTTTKLTTLPPTTKPTTVPLTTIAPSTAPPTTVRPTHAPTTTVAPSTAPPTTTTTSTSTTSTTTQKLTTSTFFSTTTTTVPETTSSTNAPTRTTSSKATTSSAPDTPPKTTKKPAGGVEPDEDYNGDGADGKGSNAKDSNTNGQVAEASSGTISLWGLLPVVFLDVILVIVLIVLIVLMFIGKKKMRAAAAKRMSKTSVKKSGRRRAKTPKSDSESGKVIMGNEKPSKKSAMKSKKDKAGDSKKKKNESKKSSKKDGKKKGAGGGAPKKNASVKGKKNKK